MKNIFSKLLTLTPNTIGSSFVGYKINDEYILITWNSFKYSDPEKEYPNFRFNNEGIKDKESVNFSVMYDGTHYPIELTNEEKIAVEYVLMTKVKECIANTKKKLNDEITKKILENRQPAIVDGGTSTEIKE